MSLSISPYNPSGYRSQLELPTLPLDLIGKVIQHKQNLYDKSFSALNSYKNTALNIDFLNEDRRAEVESLNKDLDSKFASLNGEFGDLSDSKKFNSYLSWFDGFKNNTDLIRAYKVDTKWRDSLAQLNSIKNSKDPDKKGYSQINEVVFNHHLGKYIKSKKNEEVEFRSYTPYTNIVDETTKIYKSLPKKKTVESIPDGKGYIIKKTVDGYTEDELLHVMQNMTQNQREQFRIEAEYQQIVGMKTNPTEYRTSLYDNYKSIVNDRVNYYNNKISTLEGRMLLTSSEEEKQVFKQEIEKSKSLIEDLKSDNKSQDWFLSTNEDNLLNLATQLHTNKVLQGTAKGLAAKPTIEYTIDQAHWTNRKLILDAQQFNANLAFQEQKAKQDAMFRREELDNDKLALQLKYADKSGTQEPSLFQSDGVSSVSPLKKDDITSLWKIENDLAAKSFNIADGGNYGKSFINNDKKTNDQILGDIVKLYDNNSPGGSTKKIFDFLNQTDFKDNISVNTLINALPTMMQEYYDNGGTEDANKKVGFVKTRLDQILSGNSEVLNGKYKRFAANASIYQTQKQEEISFNRVKKELYEETVRVMQLKGDWNTFTPEQQNQVQQGITNRFIERNYLPSYINKNRNYSRLGNTPTEDNLSLWKERDDLALVINEKVLNGSSNINPKLIKAYRYHEDGTVIVTLGNQKDFEDVYGDGNVPTSGLLLPNGTLTFKDKPLERDNAIDRIVEQGSVFHDNFEQKGNNVRLEFSANPNYYFLDVDINGKRQRFTQVREKSVSPRAVFLNMKNTLKSSL